MQRLMRVKCIGRCRMTSAVLSAAEAALDIKSEFKGLAEEEKDQLQGRRAAHWSYKLFIAGTVVGAVAAVAGFIFSMHIITFTGVLLTVTNGFAAFYVKRFGTLKTLEDYTKRLAEKVNDLKGVNDDLEDIQEDLEEIPEKWRNEISRGKREIAKKTAELKKLADQLESTEKKLQKLVNIAETLEKQNDEFSVEVLKLGKESHLLGERVQSVAQEVDEVGGHSQSIARLVLETDANTEEFEQLNERFSKQTKAQEDLYNLMKELFEKARNEVMKLEVHIANFEDAVPDAVDAADKAEKQSIAIQSQMEEFKATTARLEAALKKKKNYEVYRAAYDELLKMKKSENWGKIQQLYRG